MLKTVLPYLFFIFWGLNVEATAHAKSCKQVLFKNFKTSVDLYGDFDPAKALKTAGLSLRSLNLHIKNRPAGYMGSEETNLVVKLMSGKTEIGRIEIYHFDEGDWSSYRSMASSEFIGKGIGGIINLIGAEILFRLYPEAESLMQHDGSVLANYMSEKLVRTGHAIKTLDPPDDPEGRWIYRVQRHHITPRLKSFISQRRINNIKSEWKNLIKNPKK